MIKKEEQIVYVIPGNPVPLARARHTYRKVYDSQKNEKLISGINLRNQHQERPLLEGPLQLDVVFYMPIAKTRAKFAKSLIGTAHFYTPDLSNMIKFIEDVSSGILYKDDCQIVSIIAKKIYGDPRTEFTIKKLS